jgi:hypothetical protein
MSFVSDLEIPDTRTLLLSCSTGLECGSGASDVCRIGQDVGSEACCDGGEIWINREL